LYAIAYGNGLFVATGTPGSNYRTVIISPDGITWTQQTERPQNYLNGICYANGLFAAVGYGGTIVTSKENYRITGVPATANAYGVVQAGNTMPLADGTAAPGTDAKYSRGDHVHPITPDATQSAHGLMSAADKTKLDGIEGVPVPSDAAPPADGTAAPGTDAKYSRGDHVHPITPDATTEDHGLMSAADKTKLDTLDFAIPIQPGTNNGVNVNYILQWTQQTSGTTAALYGICYGNGLFVAVGDGVTILTSPDGISWTKQTSDVSSYLYAITYANGLFVAVGGGGTILTSPDGITWTQRTSGVSYTLYAIAYGNGLFVAVGDGGTILTSPDGITWTQRTSGVSDYLNGICYANGLFAAVGYGGTIVTSPDGIKWTQQTSGVSGSLRGIAYANGLFVAAGGVTILTSPDGITWTQRTSGVSDTLYAIAYGNGLFVAVGQSGTTATSPDGITWTQQTRGTTAALYGICYGNGLFVAVGGSGTILTSKENYRISGVPATADAYGVVKLDGILALQNQVAELKEELTEMRQIIKDLKQAT
jgi:GMP synthase-like glutamine amidotransferase